MSVAPLLVGLDIGTTNIKALAFTPSGDTIAQSSIQTPTYIPRTGWATYEPDALWQAVTQVLKAITSSVDRKHIVGVAVASMGEAGVALDMHNQPLYPFIAWFDPRTKPQAEWLAKTLDKDTLFNITGLSLQPIFGLCKLLWLKQNEPDIFARTVRWLNVADYIAFRLCGEQATDFSLASRTLALNIQQQRWAEDILQALDIPIHLYAPLCASGTKLGTVTAEAARVTGLPRSTTVATGGHDHVCGAFAVGVTEPGKVLNSMGTAETVFLTLDRPLTNSEIGRQGFTQGLHVVPNQSYIFGALYTSGGSIEWFRHHLTDHLSYEILMQEAQQVKPGSGGVCFLPHLQLASPPYDDPKGRGAFIGLGAEIGRDALFRSVLEGIAFDSRQMLEVMLTHGNVPQLKSICAFGGSTRNRLLMDIKATVLNRAIQVTEVSEATCLGAALLAGLGAGIYSDAAQALATLHTNTLTIEPILDAVDQYEQLYTTVYQKLYSALRPLHHSLYPLTQEGD